MDTTERYDNSYVVSTGPVLTSGTGSVGGYETYSTIGKGFSLGRISTGLGCPQEL